MKRPTLLSQITVASIAALAVGFSLPTTAQARTVFKTQGPNGAATIAMAESTQVPTKALNVTPFNLVSLAYQGHFQNQGISSAGALVQDYKTGKVTAEDLVQAAVRNNRLAAEQLNNLRYLSHVDGQLSALSQDG